MPRGRREQEPTNILLTDYIGKMSGKAAKGAEDITDPIESLRGLITSEFTKVTSGLI